MYYFESFKIRESYQKALKVPSFVGGGVGVGGGGGGVTNRIFQHVQVRISRG